MSKKRAPAPRVSTRMRGLLEALARRVAERFDAPGEVVLENVFIRTLNASQATSIRVACYLAKKLHNAPPEIIAEVYGGRAASAVRDLIRQVADEKLRRGTVADVVRALEREHFAARMELTRRRNGGALGSITPKQHAAAGMLEGLLL